MIRKYISLSLIVIALTGFYSCNDFLSTAPDNRTQINTEKKISQLLVSAYPTSNYSTLAELSSDNFVDNNARLPVILSSFNKMDDQIFAWEPVNTYTDEDSPSYVWERSYNAIASANAALQAIEELHRQDSSINLDAQKGEALICRAYGHFILANLFCQAYKDESASQADAGIPYITQPETTVHQQYDRGTVASVYRNIEQDIENGIGLITDDVYSVPKYHFNKKAAAAFAARFYLYKRDYAKVVSYAGKVLGTNPSSVLRNWNKNYDNPDAIGYDYINNQYPCNLLILPTYSTFMRIFGTRYGHSGNAMDGSTTSSGPSWSGVLPCFAGKLYIRNQQDYGVFFPKVNEMFEFTDKIAGIGYAHIARAEFTAEETLLCRAEALVYLNRTSEALSDLQAWSSSHLAPNTLTDSLIRSFYTTSNSNNVKTLNNSKMSSSFTLTNAQTPYISCVLHFRRIETMFDGLRWFDIKRYGIEIQHAIGKSSNIKTLTWNDSRRAIEIPQEVISSGIVPNQKTTNANPSGIFTPYVYPNSNDTIQQ